MPSIILIVLPNAMYSPPMRLSLILFNSMKICQATAETQATFSSNFTGSDRPRQQHILEAVILALLPEASYP